ncbi:GIY-YIG nuclease family protein [bacterium]
MPAKGGSASGGKTTDLNVKYYVYILLSLKDGNYYTGSTSDLDRRIKAHNAGRVRSTKSRRPLKLIYKEEYASKTEARKRENFLKSGQGRKVLEQILSNSEG